jgi:hypothetical protein
MAANAISPSRIAPGTERRVAFTVDRGKAGIRMCGFRDCNREKMP